MLEEGFIRISRKILSHPFWREERPYSHFEAWFDLISTARYAKGEFEDIISGVGVVKIQRGELVGSVRYLAKRWNWGEKKVRCFLKRLKDLDQIKTHQRAHPGAQPITIITLVNYDSYNSHKEHEDTPKGTPKDARRAHEGHKEEEGKESKRKFKNKNSSVGSAPKGDEEEEALNSNSESAMGESKVIGQLIDAWNCKATLRACRVISQGRMAAMKQRLKDSWWRENWREGIEKVGQSSFCSGNNDRGWKADVEWFLRPDTLANVMEGKYDDRRKTESYTDGKF